MNFADLVQQSGVPQRPFVQFEMRAMEDRAQVSPDGVTHMIDVAWAIVRAPGSKDSLEKTARDWLAQLKIYGRDGRVPASWHSEYSEAFALWEKGEELPIHGTPIKTWSPLSPAQRKNIIAIGILTIEDLAAANEETRARLGMGGVALQKMAQTWLAEAKDVGATAKKLQEATQLISEMKETLANQAEQLKQLTATKKA